MGLTGIEPALPEELDPKSSASASSATAPTNSFGDPSQRRGQHGLATSRLSEGGVGLGGRGAAGGLFTGDRGNHPDFDGGIDFAVQMNLDRVEPEFLQRDPPSGSGPVPR